MRREKFVPVLHALDKALAKRLDEMLPSGARR